MFFQLNSNNPLLNLNFSVSDPWALGFVVAAVLGAALLGHAVFTDIFKGRIIKNYINGALALIAIALLPFIYTGLGSHLLAVVAVLVFILLIGAIGAVAMGDVKLYAALTLLLGKAAVYMIFLSWLIIILYSLPIMYRTVQKNKKSSEDVPRGQRLGQSPGAPGIVLAFYVTLLGVGVSFSAVAAMFGISVATVLVLWLVDKKWGLDITPNETTNIENEKASLKTDVSS